MRKFIYSIVAFLLFAGAGTVVATSIDSSITIKKSASQYVQKRGEKITGVQWATVKNKKVILVTAVAKLPNNFTRTSVYMYNSKFGTLTLYARKTVKTFIKTPDNLPITTSSSTIIHRLTSGSSTVIADCQIFPNDNPWNQDVSKLPVRSDSTTFINSIGASGGLHPDMGGNGEYGIPFNMVESNQPTVPITFTDFGDESDPGPYPIPPDARIEGNGEGDSHVLVLQKGTCMLYELYDAHKTANGWSAASGAVFDLSTNTIRGKEGWTSADAAGLPILPGLVRYDEVAAGEITHAIRFTVPQSQRGYIRPANHYAGKNNSSLPPMGLRVRLKADYDISHFTGQAKIIATAMKKYGMIVADNGGAWFFQGETDRRWDDDNLNTLKSIPGSAFEAVDTGPIIH